MQRSLRPTLTRPPDFEILREARQELNAVDPKVRRMRVPGECYPFLELSTFDILVAWRVEITGYTIARSQRRTAAADRTQPRLRFAVRHTMEMGGARI